MGGKGGETPREPKGRGARVDDRTAGVETAKVGNAKEGCKGEAGPEGGQQRGGSRGQRAGEGEGEGREGEGEQEAVGPTGGKRSSA